MCVCVCVCVCMCVCVKRISTYNIENYMCYIVKFENIYICGNKGLILNKITPVR